MCIDQNSRNYLHAIISGSKSLDEDCLVTIAESSDADLVGFDISLREIVAKAVYGGYDFTIHVEDAPVLVLRGTSRALNYFSVVLPAKIDFNPYIVRREAALGRPPAVNLNGNVIANMLNNEISVQVYS